jgi:hypothetical protein
MAARTASGQPLHTNPLCFTRPATRKFMLVLFMGSPPSSLSTRLPPSSRPAGSLNEVHFLILLNFALAHITAAWFPWVGFRRRLVRVPAILAKWIKND